MSIATEITRLQGAKADIKSAIEAKGVTVPSNALIDTYDTYIEQIPTGGGSNVATSTITSTGSKTYSQYTTPSTFAGTGAATAYVGDILYYFGYLDSTNKAGAAKYDCTTGEYTVLNVTFQDSEYYSTANGTSTIVIGTDIYLFGGLIGSGTTTNRMYKFDTTSDTLTYLGYMGIGNVCNAQLVHYGNCIYLIGGRTDLSATQIFNKIGKYDITNNTIEQLSGPVLSGTYYMQGCCVVGNVVYIFGGYASGSGTTSVGQASYKFDMTTETLTSITQLPSPRDGWSTYVNYGDYIYIFGGRTRGGAGYSTTSILKYSITNNSYTTLTPTLPSYMTVRIGSIQIGSKLCMVGGSYTSTYENNEAAIFDFTNDTIVNIYSAFQNYWFNNSTVVCGTDYMYCIPSGSASNNKLVQKVVFDLS